MTHAMLDTMVARGASAMITNVSSVISTINIAGHVFPVTRDDGVLGGSYVCSPHSAYVLYARAELGMVSAGWRAWPARVALVGIDAMLRSARINRIIHLGNWMLSTNLHGFWRGEGVRHAREALVDNHPDHIIGIRSVDDWSSPGLRQTLIDDGWILVPSRQIWAVENLARDWLPRSNYGNDRRLVARSRLRITDAPQIDEAAAERIAELYSMLYISRYSALNPILTPAFIQESARSGMMTYRIAADTTGRIMSVAGMWTCRGVMTPSVVGYDTTASRRDGLYRVASWMFMERAMEAGWKLHASAGAAHFKRQRGAHGVIEWNAYHARHLPKWRRNAITALAGMLTRAVIPVMVKQGW